jgi:hypothetical protein
MTEILWRGAASIPSYPTEQFALSATLSLSLPLSLCFSLSLCSLHVLSLLSLSALSMFSLSLMLSLSLSLLSLCSFSALSLLSLSLYLSISLLSTSISYLLVGTLRHAVPAVVLGNTVAVAVQGMARESRRCVWKTGLSLLLLA